MFKEARTLALAPDHQAALGENTKPDHSHLSQSLVQRGRVCLRVHGSSMLPWLRHGDIAILRKIPSASIRCGDVVLFRHDTRFFVHRIVSVAGVDEVSFVTKGDANPQTDGTLTHRDILGRVECLYRGRSRIVLNTPRSRALAFLIAQISRQTSVWFTLVRARSIAMRTARRLIRVLAIS